jgi:anti-sigma regulatory factor (Ser/Thr protein kinase)/biotin operon repressor
MDVKKLILEKIKNNGQTTSREIIEETGYSRTYVNRFLRELRNEGRIVKIGETDQTRYVLADEDSVRAAKAKITEFVKTYERSGLQEDMVLDEIRRRTGIFIDLEDNVDRIVAYGFTEMLNNAIDHSGSEKVKVQIGRDNTAVSFKVRDYGIGIFQNIMEKKGLGSSLEAIQDLMKGKQTTMPERHSGEGIFFTSRVADALTFKSGEKKLMFNNRINDIVIDDISNVEGTTVLFSLDLDAEKRIEEIFQNYTEEDTYEFSDTEVLVRLYKSDIDYLSRSQARRLLVGLDEFERVMLDFADIDTVGQAFADEIFRVWQNRHPDVSIQASNANENVQFMIDRAQD